MGCQGLVHSRRSSRSACRARPTPSHPERPPRDFRGREPQPRATPPRARPPGSPRETPRAPPHAQVTALHAPFSGPAAGRQGSVVKPGPGNFTRGNRRGALRRRRPGERLGGGGGGGAAAAAEAAAAVAEGQERRQRRRGAARGEPRGGAGGRR